MEEGLIINESAALPSNVVMASAIIGALVIGTCLFIAIARPRILFGAKRTAGSSGRTLGVFVGTLAAVCVLIAPIVYTIQEGNVLTAIPLLGIRILQAIVLDNGFVDYIGGLPQGLLASLYYFLIGVGYIALPVLAALNIYELVMQRLAALDVWRIAHTACRNKNVYLFSDFNANTYGLAREALDRDAKAFVVFCSMSKYERDRWSTEISDLDSDRASILDLGYADTAVALCNVFKFSRLKCFAISSDVAKDISDTCQALEQLRGLGESGKRCLSFVEDEHGEKREKVRLYVTCDSIDDELVLDAANSKTSPHYESAGALQLVTLNEAVMAAYALLQDAPLHGLLGDGDFDADGLRPASEQKLSVIILGSGVYAEELLKGVLWCGQMHNVRLRVEVVDSQVAKLRDRMGIRYPDLQNDDYYELALTELELQSPQLDERCFAKYAVPDERLYIISAIEDDALSHELAMHARLFFLAHGPQAKIDVESNPFIACLVKNEAMSSLINTQFDEDLPGFGIVPFGCSSKLFGYDSVIDSPLEQAGQLASDVYDALYDGVSGDDFSTEHIDVGTLRKSVSETLRARRSRSTDAGNRESLDIACSKQIIHYSNLSLAIHARYKAWACDKARATDEAWIELGKNEHLRWIVFYRTQGFSYMSPADQEMYSRELAGKNARNKIEPLRRHTLMCPSEDIWANYLHAMGGFRYLAKAPATSGSTPVEIRVVGEAGETVTGLKLQLLDKRYEVIEEWDAGRGAHRSVSLPDGRYIVHPTSALPGRTCADDLGFHILDGRLRVDGDFSENVTIDVSGRPLVNPVVYDWAFAIAAPQLSEFANMR